MNRDYTNHWFNDALPRFNDEIDKLYHGKVCNKVSLQMTCREALREADVWALHEVIGIGNLRPINDLGAIDEAISKYEG